MFKSKQHPTRGYKYHGGLIMFIFLNEVLEFLVFYCCVSGVRY